MKAIIYAAGRGVRLGSASPKILLKFGGRTLLEWHAVRLREVGVSELVIVTGHLREQIAARLPLMEERHGLTVREIVNARFEQGSVLSFFVSLGEIEASAEPLLLMDADVLYPAEMLRRLVRSSHLTALLLDQNFSTADDDPVLVPVKDARPFDFRKKWTGEADFVGESVGFFKVAPEDFPLLVSATRARSSCAICPDSYDDVLREMVLAGRFGYEEATDLPWTEIDFPEDVVRAETEVLPAIERLQ
jgi:choline kinase